MHSSTGRMRARIFTVTGHDRYMDSLKMRFKTVFLRGFSLDHTKSMESSFPRHRISTGDECESGEQSHYQEKRLSRPAKATGKSGPGTMARSLVKTVMSLSHVKEEVYGALDKWAAFELKFPLEATMNGLRRLRENNQWHRVIQVSKWMLSKGIGRTNGTYSILLRAYCMDGRLEDAEALWEKVLALNDRSTPKNMFSYMTHIYKKHEMPEKVVKVFEQMESFGIKPDPDILRRAREAYLELGIEKKQEELTKKHPLNSKQRRNERRIATRKVLKASNIDGLLKEETDLRIEHSVRDESSIEESHKTVNLKTSCGDKETKMQIDHESNDKVELPPLRKPLRKVPVNGSDTGTSGSSERIEPETGGKKASSSSKKPWGTAQNVVQKSPEILHRKPKARERISSDKDTEFVNQIIATM